MSLPSSFSSRRVVAVTVSVLSLGVGACRGCEPEGGKPGAADAVAPSTTTAPAAADAAPPPPAPIADGGVVADAAAAARRPRAPGCRAPQGATSFRGRVRRPEGERSYEVRLPSPIDPDKPARVVFVIHPFGSTALDFLNATHFSEVFVPAGWAVVSPEGINKSFNAGDCCGEAAREKVDDVGFLLAIADDLREKACIDDERMYFTGFSNGGFLSQAFACAHAERVAAIGSVGAVLGVRPCAPSEPVSALLVNGIGDDVIPIDGGGPFRTRPLVETYDTWMDAGTCAESFGDAGISRSAVNAVCRTRPCREGRTLETCLVPYAHVWMVRSHPAGDAASARQTAREMLEFFDGYGVRP